MKYSKLMKERIRRVTVLFKELGYRIIDGEQLEETYSAGFESDDGRQGGFFIDRDSKFLEVAFTFSFSSSLGEFIRNKLEEMLRLCYEYGCYINIQKEKKEISFSVFSKIYFAGLSYYALRETMTDFFACVESLKGLLEIRKPQ